jgi:hypothetical protein
MEYYFANREQFCLIAREMQVFNNQLYFYTFTNTRFYLYPFYGNIAIGPFTEGKR